MVATSCSIKPIDNYHGVAFLEKKQKELLINKSNKNDIFKINAKCNKNKVNRSENTSSRLKDLYKSLFLVKLTKLL